VPAGDPRDLTGRVAIITGAGQGIGREYALAFAAAGAVPVIAEINFENAKKVERTITETGGRALAVQLDVTDPAACTKMVETVSRAFGRVDVLINNAAVFSTLKKAPFDEIPLADWDHVLRVNVNGPYYCVRAVAPAMRAAQWGRIINIATSSIGTGTPNYLHYVTSKSALLGMTNSLARELGKFNITVNTIVPGSTMTEVPREGFDAQSLAHVVARQCIPRAETPQDIVGLALFLASPSAGFVTGQAIAVNGGITHS
jgi:3-oxoacyl-[acyl-carrier protein] reductase